MRAKHRKDYKHAKQGWVGGNPRFGKANGHNRWHSRGTRASLKRLLTKAI
jgi:hypothetical protein